MTRGMDFSVEDKLDAVAYKKVLWKGLKGSRPYPVRAGAPVRISATMMTMPRCRRARGLVACKG